MEKKILLIGIGAMGTSHLKSFNNKKNYKLYLYDKYLKKSHIKKKIKNLNLNINYEICESFTKNYEEGEGKEDKGEDDTKEESSDDE